MKKYLVIVAFVVLMAILMVPAGVFADSEVIFPDPALNASVCTAVGISYGDPIMQHIS